MDYGIDLEKIGKNVWDFFAKETEACITNFKSMDSEERTDVILKTLGVAAACGIIAHITIGLSAIFFIVGGIAAFYKMTRQYVAVTPEPSIIHKALNAFLRIFKRNEL